MRILDAQFLTSAVGLKDAPPPQPDLPEFAFVGRSNVGKSSLINSLLGRKNLAKTSNTPGKTRLLNFYPVRYELNLPIAGEDAHGETVRQNFRLVDLPGYGFAKVSKVEQARWQKELTRYLEKRESLQLVVMLVDARLGLTPLDEMMRDWLEHAQKPTLVVLTKTDKLKRQEVDKAFAQTRRVCDPAGQSVILYSAKTHQGKDKVLAHLSQFLTHDSMDAVMVGEPVG